jgi:2',3'-cyclic-nucleotide 2'-phosphodiesterase (5'-nucleotidase family)
MKTFGLRSMTIGPALLLVAACAYAQGTTSGELTSANAQRAETSFGDLAADAIAAAVGTRVAFVPAISFKSGTIPAGPVTKENVSALLTQPGEQVAVVALSGAKLREALERSVSRAPQPNAGFLQVAGIVLTYDQAADRGARIAEPLTVGGAAWDANATYQVAMPLSLAKGGSGYFTIFGEGDESRATDVQLADAIVSFVAQRGNVSYPQQVRIVPRG